MLKKHRRKIPEMSSRELVKIDSSFIFNLIFVFERGTFGVFHNDGALSIFCFSSFRLLVFANNGNNAMVSYQKTMEDED
jgi:hypothetical protein